MPVDDVFDRIEKLEMRSFDGRDDRNMGLDQARQGLDLAGMVHADFEDPEFRFGRHPGEG